MGGYLLQFPLIDQRSLFIELQIALVAAFADLACCQRLSDGAAGFFSVGAVPELAGSDVLAEFGEGVLEVFLEDDLHLVGVEGGEAGGIGDQRVADGVELHMPGGVAATAQLFADLAHGEPKLRGKGVEDAGLAHAGVAGEGAEFAAEHISQLLHAKTRFGAGLDNIS